MQSEKSWARDGVLRTAAPGGAAVAFSFVSYQGKKYQPTGFYTGAASENYCHCLRFALIFNFTIAYVPQS